ncbi:MAG: bifunctional aspartate kinase/homoserine dehydrogenase I, partial [Bacteroidetes bacterium]
MKVLKFGGSSVATPERIQNIIEILKSYYQRGDRFAVVFSAFGGVTDALIEMSRRASKGEECYQSLFHEFSERHQEAVRKLIKPPLQKSILAELQANHEVLKNLLYGIYLVREASPRTMDYVLSFGERNSAFIIAHAVQQAGIQAGYLDARKIIKTDKSFGSAKVNFELTNEKIRQYFEEHPEV